jgi:hypothetical protein
MPSIATSENIGKREREIERIIFCENITRDGSLYLAVETSR